MIASLGFLPAHLYPTRAKNCLDHILLKSSLPGTALVLDSFDTGHQPVALCLNKKYIPVSSRGATFTRLDYCTANQELEKAVFDSVLGATDANLATVNLINMIGAVLNKNTQVIKYNKKNEYSKAVDHFWSIALHPQP